MHASNIRLSRQSTGNAEHADDVDNEKWKKIQKMLSVEMVQYHVFHCNYQIAATGTNLKKVMLKLC